MQMVNRNRLAEIEAEIVGDPIHEVKILPGRDVNKAIHKSRRAVQSIEFGRRIGQIQPGRRRYGLDQAYPSEREGKTLLDQFLAD